MLGEPAVCLTFKKITRHTNDDAFFLLVEQSRCRYFNILSKLNLPAFDKKTLPQYGHSVKFADNFLAIHQTKTTGINKMMNNKALTAQLIHLKYLSISEMPSLNTPFEFLASSE